MSKSDTVLLLHKDNNRSADIVSALEKDNYVVIGPYTTIADAYLAVLKEEPDFAVFDADISLEKTDTFSNTLIQLKIEHLVLLNNATQILRRRVNYGTLKGVLAHSFINVITGIRSELMGLNTVVTNTGGTSNDQGKVMG